MLISKALEVQNKSKNQAWKQYWSIQDEDWEQFFLGDY
jgi:hypothetical protein